MQDFEILSNIIKHRRAIYPSAYSDDPITQVQIDQVLHAAQWAPTHKRTEPWRFVVLKSKESRMALGLHMAEHYKAQTAPELFNETKYNKSIQNTAAAGCVIGIVLQPDLQERLPEWEELCAVACAVQNMWLTCTSLHIGAYWSTHPSISTAHTLLQLQGSERCIGYFFMGNIHALAPAGVRSDLNEKVRYL